MSDITSLPRHVKEKDVIMLRCVIKNACGIGGYASQKSLPLSQQPQIADTLLWRVATFDGLRTAHCRRSPAAWDSSRLLGFGKCWWPHQDTYLALHSRATKSLANVLRRNWHPSHWLWPTAGTNSGSSISKICSRSTTKWVCGDSTQATEGQAKQQDQQRVRGTVIQEDGQGTMLTFCRPRCTQQLEFRMYRSCSRQAMLLTDSIEQAKHSILDGPCCLVSQMYGMSCILSRFGAVCSSWCMCCLGLMLHWVLLLHESLPSPCKMMHISTRSSVVWGLQWYPSCVVGPRLQSLTLHGLHLSINTWKACKYVKADSAMAAAEWPTSLVIWR